MSFQQHYCYEDKANGIDVNITAPNDLYPQVLAVVAEDFWTHVAVGPAKECWEWEGEVDGRGYGRYVVQGGALPSQRVAYSLRFDRDVMAALVVVQLCGNPRCCNPNHLVLVERAEHSGQVGIRRK